MKKNTLYLFALTFTLFSNSQELDEEFLKTLPDDVRKDVMDKVDAKKELEKPVYRKASTQLDKDDENEDEEEDKNLDEVFGKKFFDTIQSTFMPVNEPNLGGSYILDFDDVLDVQLVGQKNLVESYPIKRDGSINIPEIGKIIISGLPLDKAIKLIQLKVNDAFIGTSAYVTLSQVRDIRILIAGNAFNPGVYTLNGNSNILHALSMAGGIDNIGSYRNILHMRNNEIVSELDIYDVLIFGKMEFNTSLRSGDTILVNPAGKLVSIESGVLRPGKYELKEGEKIIDLIKFANGLNQNADIDNVIIKRIAKGKSKVIDINYADFDSLEIVRGDGIFIREFKFNTVRLSGAVKNPGTYFVPLGTKLSDLILDAGGYEDTAYPFGGYLDSEKALKINEDSQEKLYEKFLNNFISNPSIATSDEGFSLLLKQLKDAKATGRVIAEFDLDMLRANPDLDTILEDGDKIIVPNITQQVYVQGEVSNPGAIRYKEGEDINYYMRGSGGELDSADMSTLFVIHPNGETKNLQMNSRFSFMDINEDETLVYPGSIIFVPRSTDLADSLEVASIWAPILSSVALSLTSLSVLNNN